MLAYELMHGAPQIVVSVGREADLLLDFLLRERLIPALPRRHLIQHYSYIGSRPDRATGLGPGHPDRIERWSRQFAEICQLLTRPRPT